MKKLVYLATPYSHENKSVEWQRYEVVTRVAARLMERGIFVYSPITHCHPMTLHAPLPGNWDFWKEFDTIFLEMCQVMVIVKQDGWQDSKGVKAETELFRSINPDFWVIPYNPDDHIDVLVNAIEGLR